MSAVTIIFFKDNDGAIPAKEFFANISVKARAKLNSRLQLLERLGHELRRPHCENLGSGIYELRTRYRTTQYRLLYFFHGTQAVVVSHGLIKEREIPPTAIELAIQHKTLFLSDPFKHGHISQLRVL
jgi:phage-related protein